MSSTIRTPWPSRSAPHHWIASQIDGSPNASPAWIVKWAFSRWRYSNASRCRVGGYPASAPAMSNPHDAAVAVRDRELGDLPEFAACRIAVTICRTTIGWPAAAARPSPSSKPVPHGLHDLVEGQARASGAARARTAPRHRRRRPAARSSAHSRGHPAQVLGALHHGDRVVERLEVAHQRSGVGGVDEPAVEASLSRPAARALPRAAISSTVCGRRPPSRWSCRSALGLDEALVRA